MDVILKIVLLEDDTLYEKAFSMLGAERRNRVKQAKNPRAKAHIAWGELALRLALREIETPRFTPEYGENEFGKPFLKNAPEIRFSLSSTTRAVCAAICGGEVGVDMERRREVNMTVTERFAPEERQSVLEDPRRFFEIWTKKEAFMKYRGLGFNLPLKSFSVLDMDFYTLEREGLVLALCTGGEAAAVKTEFLTEKQALEILCS